MEKPLRFSAIWSSAHKLWFVYDRVRGQYVEHSETEAGAARMAAKYNETFQHVHN